jgi:asparagine N-glycosylation enzyme membrane subunit Stt3
MFLEPADQYPDNPEQQRRVDAIVARGPGGAFALAGIAVAIVMAVWLAFYFLVFVVRGGD